MKHLGKMFGSDARVKLMRLFLFNEDQPFDVEDIATRSKVKKPTVRKEANLLHKIGFLHKKKFTKTVTLKPLKKGKEKREKSKKASGWVLNKKYPLAVPLYTLLIESELIKTKEFPQRLKGTGSVKLLVLSGIFVKDTDRSLDVLIVGDKLKKKEIEKRMSHLEAEVGKEIRYAVFDEQEFAYRMDMYDKLLRDVFDYEHTKVVNKLKKHF